MPSGSRSRRFWTRWPPPIKRAKPGEWIEGWGWNQEVWTPPVFPAKEDLDQVAPDIPVYLERTDGHAAWVNSKALAIAGITRDTPNPQGGEIVKDGKGEPTGILVDTATDLVSGKIAPPGREKILEAIRLAEEEMISNGLTGAQDAGCDLEFVTLLKRLYESEKLSVRLYERLRIPDGSTTLGDEFYAAGKQIGLYNNHLTVRGVKAFSGRSPRFPRRLDVAALLRIARTDSGEMLRITEERFYALVKRARQAGFQVSTHAIGDAANRLALDVYERVLKETA